MYRGDLSVAKRTSERSARAAPPDLVLGAALQGQPLPAPSPELYFIVVDPGVAGRWRIATADDVAALERSTTTWPPSP